MNTSEYIENLILFYNEISKFPLVRLSHQLGKSGQHFVQINFRNESRVIEYNLGFKIRSSCYVSKNLAMKNIRILETINGDEFSTLFTTVTLKKKKAIFKVYDIFGNKINKFVIKFCIFNLF
jgi:hypothetical protein